MSDSLYRHLDRARSLLIDAQDGWRLAESTSAVANRELNTITPAVGRHDECSPRPRHTMAQLHLHCLRQPGGMR